MFVFNTKHTQPVSLSDPGRGVGKCISQNHAVSVPHLKVERIKWPGFESHQRPDFFQAPLVQLSQLHLTFKDPSISFIKFYSQFKIWFISLRFWNSTAKLLSPRQFLVQVDIICHRMGAHLNVCDLLRLRLLLKGITPISQFYCTVGYIVDERLCLGVLLKYATCGLLGFSPYFI